MFRQQQIHPDQAEIYDQPNFNSYGKRSFKGILLMGVAIAFGASVLIWGISKGNEEARANQELSAYARTSTDAEMAATQPQAGAGQTMSKMPRQADAQPQENQGILSSIKSAISSLGAALPMASGPYDGETVAPSGAVVSSSGQFHDAMLTMEIQEKQAEAITEAAETAGSPKSISGSIYDYIGNEVQDSDKSALGIVHDVIIDRETGEGIAILVDTNNNYYGSPLRALSYEEVVSENAEEGVEILTSEDVVENRSAFDYQNLNGDKYVSLLFLQKGKIVDFENREVGAIEGVTYRESKAQDIYIRLDETMVPAGKKHVFELPFSKAQTLESANGYDVKLTKDQTRKLAAYLYQ